MKKLSAFVDAVLAGICIGIGGTVFLSCENKVTGAVFFCLGLFAICTFGFNLFTGKVGYVLEQPLSYTGFVLWVWLGNLVGTGLVGYAIRMTRIVTITEKAAVLCQTKLDDSLISIFILSLLPPALIYENAHDVRAWESFPLSESTLYPDAFMYLTSNISISFLSASISSLEQLLQ